MGKERTEHSKPLDSLENQGLPESQTPGMKGKVGGRYRRLQIDFSPRALERLRKIREATDASTYTGIIRNALRVYEWYLDGIDGKERGVRFRVVEGDITKEIEPPLL